MKKNIAVLFGGPSVEHDVSIITGMQVVKNLDISKYNVAPIYWAKDGNFYSKDVTESLQDFAKRHIEHPVTISFGQKIFKYKAPGILFSRSDYRPDVVIPCFHGTGGEDGVIQGMLESLNIPYAGSSVSASAVGMDKALFKAVMRENKLPVLDYKVITKSSGIDIKSLGFDFPIIAKPAHLGSSIGVKKCENIKDMDDALEVIFALDTHAIIEPYLQEMIEINCSVLGTTDECQTSVCEQPMTSDEVLTFTDKYLSGGKGKKGLTKNSGMASLDRRIPAEIEKSLELRITNYAKDVYKAVGCSGVARIDYMVTKKNEIYITEINTIPGSLSFYLWEASGMSFRELLDKLVDSAEFEYKKKKALLRTFESSILEKQI